MRLTLLTLYILHITLGQSESGKSTTLRNLKLIYTPNAVHDEALTWRAIIHLNLLKTMKIVINATLQASIDPSSQIPVTDEHRRLALRLAPLEQVEELLRMRISLPEDDTHPVVASSTDFAVSSAAGWKEAFLKLRGQRGDAGTKEEFANILEACASDMTALWSDPVIRNIVRQKCLRLEECPGLWVPSLLSASSSNPNRYRPVSQLLI